MLVWFWEEINSLLSAAQYLAVLYRVQVQPDQLYRDLSNPAVSSLEPQRVKELVTIYTDPYEAAFGAHAIVVLTEWDAFKVGQCSMASSTRRIWIPLTIFRPVFPWLEQSDSATHTSVHC